MYQGPYSPSRKVINLSGHVVLEIGPCLLPYAHIPRFFVLPIYYI